jgi:hypothetical protein
MTGSTGSSGRLGNGEPVVSPLWDRLLIDEVLRAPGHILVQAPTGSGKTLQIVALSHIDRIGGGQLGESAQHKGRGWVAQPPTAGGRVDGAEFLPPAARVKTINPGRLGTVRVPIDPCVSRLAQLAGRRPDGGLGGRMSAAVSLALPTGLAVTRRGRAAGRDGNRSARLSPSAPTIASGGQPGAWWQWTKARPSSPLVIVRFHRIPLWPGHRESHESEPVGRGQSPAASSRATKD